MPPKKKRGGGTPRGRRGRPPKKNASQSSPLSSPAPEQLDSNETSSSNSPVLGEAAPPEIKVKLETKIHKKFGIKYHVPDEIAAPICHSPIIEDKSQLPIAGDISNSHIPLVNEPAEGVNNDFCIESSQDVPAAVVEMEFEDKVDVGSSDGGVVEEGPLEHISEQLHQLEVAGVEDEDDEEVEQYIVEEGVELDGIDDTTIVEYVSEGEVISHAEEEIILETETEYVSMTDDSTEEVYYVMEVTEDSGMELEEKMEPEVPNFINSEDVKEESFEMQEESVLNNSESADEVATAMKLKEEKLKSPEKTPSRKSRRISEKGTKVPDISPCKTEIKSEIKKEEAEDVKMEPEIVQTPQEAMEATTTEEISLAAEPVKEETPSETIVEETEPSLNESVDSIQDVSESPKKAKKVKKPVAKPTKKTKDAKDKETKDVQVKEVKDNKDNQQEKEEKSKKSKKQVTFKVQSKVKKAKELKPTTGSPVKPIDEEDPNVRRSSRIKTISTQKVRSRGKGLVKKDEVGDVKVSTAQVNDDKSVFVAPTSTTDMEHKPVKVKSRWRRSSELEMRDTSNKIPPTSDSNGCKDVEKKKQEDNEVERRLKQFIHLKENVYLTERISCKEAKKMLCDCFLTEEEIEQGEYGCGDDCLNRLLMIECGNLCTVGDRCTNKRFQKMQSALVEAFNTEKKGLGIRAVANIPSGEFILEYVGEVLDPDKFEQRAGEYSKDKNQHYYFMSLRADAIIDATIKGNISRFINHSCEPNAETQKWTVNGELRIGFFSKRMILAGEEITFDYQFQRYGKEAQKCFCEMPGCRGWLGEEPDDEDDDDEDDDDEEEDEEEEQEHDESAGNKDEVKKAASKKSPKKERAPKQPKKPKELKPRRLARKDRFEDIGIDDEIESLQTTGLKNQAQTLKLSRLMVRAKEPGQRTKLLKLLKKGEFPCRRLFLDYHGLRLIHGWMTDAQHLAKMDASMDALRLEILQTLAMLPIPNKTMLQDSKVLSTVEKWSKKDDSQEVSPPDSDSNSPNADPDNTVCQVAEEKKTNPDKDLRESVMKQIQGTVDIETNSFTHENGTVTSSSSSSNSETANCIDNDDEMRKSTGMESSFVKVIPEYNVDSIKDELLIIFDDDFVPLDIPIKTPKLQLPPKPKYDVLVEIIALALKLLEEWAGLKEVFRIPKKERIEQMKEHEREADRRYKAVSEQETERRRDRYRSFRAERSSRPDTSDRSKERSKTERYPQVSKMTKQERREQFARQVEQAEEEERRRKQQERWAQHFKNCLALGTDPRIPNMQYAWNAQLGQWQNIVSTDPTFAFPPNAMQPGMLPPTIVQPTMTPANMGTMPPMPNIPPQPAIPFQEATLDDPSKVQFMGPIPPPVDLPPKWKCAKDKYGRPYYYHVKIRKSQWEPPVVPPEEEAADDDSETTSSSDTSSLSSSSSSEDSDSDDDTRLMLEIRNKFNKIDQQKKLALAKKEEEMHQPLITTEITDELPAVNLSSSSILQTDDTSISDMNSMLSTDTSRLEQSHIQEDSPMEIQGTEQPPTKKRRLGLVQELIISPRTEEDRLQFREDVKKYRQNKEIVRKQKESIMQQAKKQKSSASSSNSDKTKEKPPKKKISTKMKIKEMEANTNVEESKRIKEAFRSSMASVMVGILNPYRKPDCKEGRITSTEDFKHLARKLTHFVMLKELKHCDRIEDLECTESVKVKAKEFVRKYMAKFNEVYQRPSDEVDNF